MRIKRKENKQQTNLKANSWWAMSLLAQLKLKPKKGQGVKHKKVRAKQIEASKDHKKNL